MAKGYKLVSCPHCTTTLRVGAGVRKGVCTNCSKQYVLEKKAAR